MPTTWQILDRVFEAGYTFQEIHVDIFIQGLPEGLEVAGPQQVSEGQNWLGGPFFLPRLHSMSAWGRLVRAFSRIWAVTVVWRKAGNSLNTARLASDNKYSPWPASSHSGQGGQVLRTVPVHPLE